MLTSLTIKGLAIVEELSIKTTSGFNVITGETGAGKSILIKALGLLLGAKASHDTVRAGFEQAMICGTFYLPPAHPACLLARDMHIPFEEDHSAAKVTMIIRRSIQANGKSGAWINDIPVTAASLRQLGPYLIDIYAQHETGKLLDAQTHTMLLDEFSRDPALADVYREHFKACLDIIGEIKEKTDFVVMKARERDYLQFRVEELDQFAPSLEDYLETAKSIENLESSSERSRHLQELHAAMHGGAEGGSLSAPLKAVIRIAQRAKALPGITEEIVSLAEQALQAVNEASYILENALNADAEAEQDIDALNQRIGRYQDFFRKFGTKDIEGLLLAVNGLRSDLESLDSVAAQIAGLLQRLRSGAGKANDCAARLTAQREAAARSVSKQLESELAELAMPHAKMHVVFSPAQTQPWGLDLTPIDPLLERDWQAISPSLEGLSFLGKEKARFLLSANKGEQPKALDKVASGGELSRIMLAVKKALSAGADSCVLVFDEIDSGISGRVADVVGRKIKGLSRQFQVICISHLPQVAAYADTHFKVEKKTVGKRTESFIFSLNRKERIQELARLLSGDQITAESLANAERLLSRASATGPAHTETKGKFQEKARSRRDEARI